MQIPPIFRRLIQDQTGGIAVPMALLFPILIGMVSLAVEYGSWQSKRTHLQNLADTAVYSAAIDLIQGGNTTTLEASIAKVTDLTPGAAGNPSLNYAIPPTQGSFAGQEGYIEVTIIEQVPRLLSKLFASDQVVIKTRAVASYGSGKTTACMLALSTDAAAAIEVSGNADAYFTGCSLVSNSASDRSFVMSGGSVSVEAGCIDAVGGVEYTSNLTLTDCDAPRTLQPKTMDPYADLEVPNISLISNCVSGGNFQDQTLLTDAGTLSGYPYKCYTGNVGFRGAINLSPGLYVIKSGSFSINAGAVVTGTGVTFLLSSDSTLTVNGSAELHLSAPTSGEFAGILFMGERSGTEQTHSFSGNSGSALDGVFYFPKDEFSFTGSSSGTSNCVQFLSSRISISGNTDLTVGCPPSSGKVIYTNLQIALRE